MSKIRKNPETAKKELRGRGRPAGAKTQPAAIVAAEATRCPRCGSTDRDPYRRKNEQAYPGVHDGKPYTHIVRRWTRCATPGCGQHRIDKSFENRAGTQV